MRRSMRCLTAVVVAGALLLSGCTTIATRQALEDAQAKIEMQAGHEEYPIGDPQTFDFVQLDAFYSPPSDMKPAGMGLPAAQADIHLEANLTALEGNGFGLPAGAWIPYATIQYTITGPDGESTEGTFMPMLSNHGQHYGSNVKLDAAGTYQITYTVRSPAENGLAIHGDKLTGVSGEFWNSPLVASWDFDYLPREW
ncbi:MAG: iron transporter [Propionicimonas sp.]